MKNIHVWLAYVAYPVTTAAYLERALRSCCRTTTIGPPFPPELIERWKLQNMKLPLTEQNISTGPNPDMKALLAATPPGDLPDLYLWVESVGGHYPLNLGAVTCPKVCYLIDSHLNLATHLEWAKEFDMVFIAQREYLDDFRRQGIRVHWLPLACCPDIHRRTEPTGEYQVGFVGSVQPGTRREGLLSALSATIPVHYERCFWDDMAQVFSRSKIVFNEAVKNDLNMRVFEVMATGSLLLSDMARNSGQDELFRAGEDYALYRDAAIGDVAAFYLENEELREQIAARGQRLVLNAHTYGHRVEDLLAVALEGKSDTCSAGELRQRSLVNVPAVDRDNPAHLCIGSSSRSFVIPVLDMSPASEYNIVTLLEDLQDIEGEVIIVFNGQEIAEHLKSHPRITRYAVLKQNIGVARAWNLGLEMAVTPVVFILNADLHLEQQAVDELERALTTLPLAACVGPQGSFVEFSMTRDYVYYDKGAVHTPMEVDAVSGFFFAIRLQHFNDKIIRFENGFTPCYFEEWDLGLQIKRAGLKSYVVPVTSYDHHWSGSIRALREIGYYEQSRTAGEILLKNRKFFLNKWQGIADRDNNRELLESLFFSYISDTAQGLAVGGHVDAARQWLDDAARYFPDESKLAPLRRFIDVLARKAGGGQGEQRT